MKKRFAKKILAFMLVIMVFMTDIPTFARDNRDLEETNIESTEETQMSIPASASHLSGHRKPLFRF